MMAKILVVDDSVTLRRMVTEALESFGHDVTHADCGEVALAALDGFKADLILTDLYMPGLDGIGLAAEVRKLPNHGKTPILVLSTDSSDEVKQRGKSNGVNGWIAKPFDPSILDGVIKQVLH